MGSTASRFGWLTGRARAVCTLLALGAVGVLALGCPAPVVAPPPGATGGDAATFLEVVARLRTGTPYYAAMGSELRRAEYPTRSVFNWRTPFLLSAVSAVPEAVGRAVLVALLILLCFATAAITRPTPAAVWVSVAMQLGVVGTMSERSALVMGEAWAGVLVGLSVCAYAFRRRGAGVALGLLALFVRELAAPYCVACVIVAAANRRWRELGAWLVGACGYAAYYGWHLSQVRAQQLPTDLAHASSWLEFRGLPFLMATIHWQGWLLVLPTPLAAAMLVLIVAGILNTRAPFHVRAASAAYVAFFLAAGRPFNGYWGLTAAPTWALACGYGVSMVRRAIGAASAPPESSTALSPR